MSGELLALQQRLKAPRRRSDTSRRLPWLVGIALVVIAGVPLVMRSWPAAPPRPSASVTGVTAGAPDTASTNIPVETLSAAPAIALDEDTVRDRLAQYASAYASLSVLKTADVWPSVDREALGQAFAALRSVDLRFDRCDVDVAGVRATARCAGILTYVRRIGSSVPITAKQAWLFDLRRSDGDWLIQQVSSSLGQGLP